MVKLKADATAVVPAPASCEEAAQALSHPAEVAMPRSIECDAEDITWIKRAEVADLGAQHILDEQGAHAVGINCDCDICPRLDIQNGQCVAVPACHRLTSQAASVCPRIEPFAVVAAMR
eukprot:3447287-Prymnesium_polylepis.3